MVLAGQHFLRQLVRKGIKCSYVLINAVTYIMKEVGVVGWVWWVGGVSPAGG